MRLARRPALRETKFARAPLATVTANGSFSGYAALFNSPDMENDIIEPGAFAASLRQRGAAGIRMLFQHDPAQPIGTWTAIREDGRGLHVRGLLALSAPRGREVFELLRAGAVDGLSIGFRAIKARPSRKSGTRRILAADLWEVSVVTFPMQPGARIISVAGPPRAKSVNPNSDMSEASALPHAPRILAAQMRRAALALNDSIAQTKLKGNRR